MQSNGFNDEPVYGYWDPSTGYFVGEYPGYTQQHVVENATEYLPPTTNNCYTEMNTQTMGQTPQHSSAQQNTHPPANSNAPTQHNTNPPANPNAPTQQNTNPPANPNPPTQQSSAQQYTHPPANPNPPTQPSPAQPNTYPAQFINMQRNTFPPNYSFAPPQPVNTQHTTFPPGYYPHAHFYTRENSHRAGRALSPPDYTCSQPAELSTCAPQYTSMPYTNAVPMTTLSNNGFARTPYERPRSALSNSQNTRPGSEVNRSI